MASRFPAAPTSVVAGNAPPQRVLPKIKVMLKPDYQTFKLKLTRKGCSLPFRTQEATVGQHAGGFVQLSRVGAWVEMSFAHVLQGIPTDLEVYGKAGSAPGTETWNLVFQKLIDVFPRNLRIVGSLLTPTHIELTIEFRSSQREFVYRPKMFGNGVSALRPLILGQQLTPKLKRATVVFPLPTSAVKETACELELAGCEYQEFKTFLRFNCDPIPKMENASQFRVWTTQQCAYIEFPKGFSAHPNVIRFNGQMDASKLPPELVAQAQTPEGREKLSRHVARLALSDAPKSFTDACSVPGDGPPMRFSTVGQRGPHAFAVRGTLTKVHTPRLTPSGPNPRPSGIRLAHPASIMSTRPSPLQPGHHVAAAATPSTSWHTPVVSPEQDPELVDSDGAPVLDNRPVDHQPMVVDQDGAPLPDAKPLFPSTVAQPSGIEHHSQRLDNNRILHTFHQPSTATQDETTNIKQQDLETPPSSPFSVETVKHDPGF